MALSFFLLLISTSLLSYVFTFDATGGFCQSPGIQQSPVNIVSDETVFYEEKYFRILTNRYINLDVNNTWTYDANAKAIGVSPYNGQGDFGSIIFIKDWGFVNLILQRINFRVSNGNSIDGKKFSAEIELIHTVDANYYSPGKRVDLGTDYFVISVPLTVTSDNDPEATTLFKWMNLEGYFNGTSPNMARPIKLYTMIQHQPAFLYDGTLPYGDCLPAWYLQFTQYHLITATDLDRLVSVTNKLTGLTVNTRGIQTLNTVVYRNWDDKTKLKTNLNLLSFQNSNVLKSSLLMLLAVISLLLI